MSFKTLQIPNTGRFVAGSGAGTVADGFRYAFIGGVGATSTFQLPDTGKFMAGSGTGNTVSDPFYQSMYLVSPVILTGLPTADPHVVGQVWANSNVLTLSAG